MDEEADERTPVKEREGVELSKENEIMRNYSSIVNQESNVLV